MAELSRNNRYDQRSNFDPVLAIEQIVPMLRIPLTTTQSGVRAVPGKAKWGFP